MTNPKSKSIPTSNSEEVVKFFKEMEHGGTPGKSLKLDTKTGKIVVTSSTDETKIDLGEATMFSTSTGSTIVLLQEELDDIFLRSQNLKNPLDLSFKAIDTQDVFRLSRDGIVTGKFYNIMEKIEENTILKTCLNMHEHLLVIFYYNASFKAYLLNQSIWSEVDVLITPPKNEIFSRINGIYETGILSNKTVLIIGLGSGGSPVALELVKQGVQNFILVDHDKLEIGNISRHICGLSDLGRYKTKAVADILRNKNLYVNVTTHEINIVEASNEYKKLLIQNADLVICGTDNRESKMAINRLCVDNGKVCIYGGAFRRAYGGQVLKVIPNQTLCYQCFINQLPKLAEDYEISNLEQAEQIAYSDFPVPIEPGLSTDIAPISNFISKLAILELLKGQSHTIASLYEDLSEAIYVWFNRREETTVWKDYLVPLRNNIGDMSILRWYGIAAEKNEHCSVCGEFQIDITER